MNYVFFINLQILQKLFGEIYFNSFYFKIYFEITLPQSAGCFTANSQDFIILFYFRAYATYEDSIEVCPATEHEERKLLVEYLEKLKLYESNSVAQKRLPHPLEIER